jgi:vancomycin permeability regulator SanA
MVVGARRRIVSQTCAMTGAGAWRTVLRILIVCTALGVGWFVLAFVLVSSAASDAQGHTATADAIVVLGAAQYNGEPSPVLQRRLTTALDLWEQGAAPQIVTTGASQPGDSFTEGFASFQFLRNAGVPEEWIVVVVDGGDTYESLLAAANQLGEDERSVIVVTDAYHARRSADIASEVGLDPTVIAAGDDTSFGRRFRESIAVGLGRIVSYRRLSAWR